MRCVSRPFLKIMNVGMAVMLYVWTICRCASVLTFVNVI